MADRKHYFRVELPEGWNSQVLERARELECTEGEFKKQIALEVRQFLATRASLTGGSAPGNTRPATSPYPGVVVLLPMDVADFVTSQAKLEGRTVSDLTARLLRDARNQFRGRR